MSIENILTGAVNVLAERGRGFEGYEDAGKPCVLGALAIAADRDADYWWVLQDATEFSGTDIALIGAARALASVVAPEWADAGVEDLVMHVGRWHDGTRRPGDVRPANSAVFAALKLAAERASLSVPAEQIEVNA